MDASAGLFVSLAVSTVGAALFVYGRKQGRVPQVVAGLLLGIYPYFVPGIGAMLGIGGVILLGLWVALRRGV